MNTTQRSLKEIAAQAHATYDRLIKQKVEKDHHGKFVTIEVDNGDYEISEDMNDLDAYRRLKARNPDGQFFLLRIGYGWVAEFKSPRFKVLK